MGGVARDFLVINSNALCLIALDRTGDHGMEDVGFVSGATLQRVDESPQELTASTSKQATLGSYFGASEGSKYEIKKRERAFVSDKDCYR